MLQKRGFSNPRFSSPKGKTDKSRDDAGYEQRYLRDRIFTLHPEEFVGEFRFRPQILFLLPLGSRLPSQLPLAQKTIFKSEQKIYLNLLNHLRNAKKPHGIFQPMHHGIPNPFLRYP